MEWGVAAEMKLAIIFIWVTQIVQMICRRPCHPKICRPIVIFFLAFKHLLCDSAMILISKIYFYLHFKEINKTSNDKRNEDVSPVCCLQAHDVNHHSKHYQYTSVAPKKTQRLDGVINNFLPFLYRLNLHVLLINIFHRFIVPIQFLKIHVFPQKEAWLLHKNYGKKIHFRRF